MIQVVTVARQERETEFKPEEKKLLDYIRELEWGEITVIVKAGKPVMITHPLKNVKLTDN